MQKKRRLSDALHAQSRGRSLLTPAVAFAALAALVAFVAFFVFVLIAAGVAAAEAKRSPGRTVVLVLAHTRVVACVACVFALPVSLQAP